MSYTRAAEDLSVDPTQLRNWVKQLADGPQHAFPGHGQMKPEQLEIAQLKREVAGRTEWRGLPEGVSERLSAYPRISMRQARERGEVNG